MERTPVSSSNIAAIGYDEAEQVLEVEFTSGSIYRYTGIPQGVFDGLMGATSHGKYFNKYIKNGGYPCFQVR